MYRLVEVHCPKCGKLLGKAQVGSVVEIKCPRCALIIRWPGNTGEIVTHDPSPGPSEKK